MKGEVAVEGTKRSAALTIDGGEPPEKRMERMIKESPVVIFSRRSCCMCHVMRRLLATVGVHPTVIELEEAEEEEAAAAAAAAEGLLPAVFIGGELVGGLEGLVALHLSERLVPRLREVGALWR
ncbi:Glutaredoxin-C6 [Apostasia shenzhenica]|uniref:Glutaredoxin-C6 n=1 Tax=Apostasia shenzhenica TaxID=1088818 RepID=A0A2I0ALN4_9ASPA|nr:Glutaredoxin-C6 [Apostasia shenzhenica]